MARAMVVVLGFLPVPVRVFQTATWTFLEQPGETERWNEAGVPEVSGFLSWLRIGRTVEHVLVTPTDGPSAGDPESPFGRGDFLLPLARNGFRSRGRRAVDARGTASAHRPAADYDSNSPAVNRSPKHQTLCRLSLVSSVPRDRRRGPSPQPPPGREPLSSPGSLTACSPQFSC